MMEDTELLRRYATSHTEEDFAEIVRRHVNLVYSCALRQVNGDAHLAQDITQLVFTDLARKAESVASHRVLAGWLFTSTRFAAAKAVRGEQRRHAREAEAHLMEEFNRDSAAQLDWARVRPVLDEVLGELSESDREAILLRYFEGRDFASVGARLNVNDNTARMRTERALDKLRALLERRGVKSTGAALAAALANQAVVAAPAGLAVTVTGAALAGSGVVAGGAAAGGAITTFMSVTKLQLGVMGALTIACGTTMLWQQRTNGRQKQDLRDETARLRNQNDALRIEARESDSLRRENAQLRQASARQVGNPPSSSPLVDASAASAPVIEAPNGVKNREAWRNVGRATPAAAYETVMWASDRGDLDVLVVAFVLNDVQKTEAVAVFKRLPEDSRSQYGTPERMMALLFASGTPAAIQPVSEIVTGPDDTIVRARVWNDRKETKELELPFHRYPDGWRVVVPDWQMNKSLAGLR